MKKLCYRASYQDTFPLECKFEGDFKKGEQCTSTDGKMIYMINDDFTLSKGTAWKRITEYAKTEIILSGREVERCRRELEEANAGAGRSAEKYRLVMYNEDNPYRDK